MISFLVHRGVLACELYFAERRLISKALPPSSVCVVTWYSRSRLFDVVAVLAAESSHRLAPKSSGLLLKTRCWPLPSRRCHVPPAESGSSRSSQSGASRRASHTSPL